MSMTEILAAIDKNCDLYKIDKKFLKALIQTESGFNPKAVRFEPTYKYTYSVKECAIVVGCTASTMEIMQKTSWGLCQIMGAIYYEMQGKDWATTLIDPEMNIRYACLHIQKLHDHHSILGHEYLPEYLYAVYNAGSVRRKFDGSLVNQANVDRFKKHYDNLKQF